eukprot:CCRYP_011239-RA/>CCRYP_011239-RA protein AED:0.42 eAED:0.42 QI:18/1/1/1/0/0/2/84/48
MKEFTKQQLSSCDDNHLYKPLNCYFGGDDVGTHSICGLKQMHILVKAL